MAEDTFRKAKAERDRAAQKAAMLHSGNVDMVSQSFTLAAPGSGEVLVRNLSLGVEVQGQYSGGQSQELFTIGELDEVWIIADVYELDMARVTIGSPASVKVVAYPDKVFGGKVDWVSGMLDPTSRTAKVRCKFANAERLLKPEMYATVSISVEAHKELAIPKGSAVRLGDKTFVFVQRGKAPDGRMRFDSLPVSVDEGEDSQWLPVQTGLVKGDQNRHFGDSPALGHAGARHVAFGLLRNCLDPPTRRLRAADALRHPQRRRSAHHPRARSLQAARHRGLSEPRAADDRGHRAARRVERGGGRALRHGAARDRPGRHAGAVGHALAVALQPEST